jgi:hypothetical protein
MAGSCEPLVTKRWWNNISEVNSLVESVSTVKFGAVR